MSGPESQDSGPLLDSPLVRGYTVGMAQLLKDAYPLPDLPAGLSDWRNSEHEKEFQRLQREETVISFGVADGGAYYLVKSMKPLKLQHIPYMDAYQVPYAMIRGLRKADVEAMVDRKARGWNF